MNDSLFNQTVQTALKHYHDHSWLESNSPLATTFFLGWQRVKNSPTIGHALQNAIFEATKQLYGENTLPQSKSAIEIELAKEISTVGLSNRYYFHILNLRYFRYLYPHSRYPATVTDLYEFLNIGKSSFHRHLKYAEGLVAQRLLKLLTPHLNLDSPTLPKQFIGRENTLSKISNALHNNSSVALSGQGGIGKSSLGVKVKKTWEARFGSNSVFWLTVRPGINDDLGAILFTLAYFLHKNNCNNLWMQLSLNLKTLGNQELSLALLRTDLKLAYANDKRVLVCFDETDLLQTDIQQSRHGAHKQILEFLESLKEMVPLLLIGQRVVVDTDIHFELQALTEKEISKLFVAHDVSLNLLSISQISRNTLGNPRLIELYISLIHIGGFEEEFKLQSVSATKPLFNRLWKRLNNEEKQLITLLSVFRSDVPENALQASASLQRLAQRRLLSTSKNQRIALLNFYRDLIYSELSPNQKKDLHEIAVRVRIVHGMFTSAAYHYIQAGQINKAIDVWYHNQDSEIDMGMTGSAYEMFKLIQISKISSERHRKKLILINNRLASFNGNFGEVLENTHNFSWELDKDLNIKAYQQLTEAYLQLDNTETALNISSDAIRHVNENLMQLSFFNERRFKIFFEEMGESKIVQIELRKNEASLRKQQGIASIMNGDFRTAKKTFQEFITIAKEVEDTRLIGEANYWLSFYYSQIGSLKEAQEYASKSMVEYEKIGDRHQLEHVKASLAGYYLNTGEYEKALIFLIQSRGFFQNFPSHVRMPYLDAEIAEAYHGVGDYEQARKFALQAIGYEKVRVQPYAYLTLGLVYYEWNEYDNSDLSFERGLEIAQNNEDRFIEAYLQRAYGECLCKREETHKGLLKLEAGLTLFDKMKLGKESKKTHLLITKYSSD